MTESAVNIVLSSNNQLKQKIMGATLKRAPKFGPNANSKRPMGNSNRTEREVPDVKNANHHSELNYG